MPETKESRLPPHFSQKKPVLFVYPDTEGEGGGRTGTTLATKRAAGDFVGFFFGCADSPEKTAPPGFLEVEGIDAFVAVSPAAAGEYAVCGKEKKNGVRYFIIIFLWTDDSIYATIPTWMKKCWITPKM